MAIKQYPGAAEVLSLNADINNAVTSFACSETPSSQWPTGGDQYVVKIAKADNTNEEKILLNGNSRIGSAFSSVQRGYDGTSAISHAAGEKITVVWDAASARDASRHIYTTTDDDHPQYLNTTRHDTTARHIFGSALPTPAAPADVSDTAAAGAAAGPARADHVHALGAAVAGTGLGLAAGALFINDGDALGFSGDNLVVKVDGTTLEISADALRIAAGAAGNGLTGGGGSALAVGASSPLTVTADAVGLLSGYLPPYAGSSAPGSPVAGQLWFDTTNKLIKVYNGSVWITITPVSATVVAAETKTTNTYGDLTTPGPAVTVDTGTAVLIEFGSAMGGAGTGPIVSFDVSGATTRAANDDDAVEQTLGATHVSSFRRMKITGLTAGSNTFTLKYKSLSSGQSCSFSNRDITVLPLWT